MYRSLSDYHPLTFADLVQQRGLRTGFDDSECFRERTPKTLVISPGKKKKQRSKKRSSGSVHAAEVAVKSDAIRAKMVEIRKNRKGPAKHSTEVFETQSVGPDHPEMKRTLALARGMKDAFALSSPLSKKPFKVTRSYRGPSITDSFGGTGEAFYVNLDNFPDYTDFVAIFDQYRFTKVRVLFCPRNNVQSLTAQATAATELIGQISVCFDPDDASTPASQAEVLAYSNVRTYNGCKTFKYEFHPRAAIAAYGGAFTSYADFDGWCDCASDDIEWYACKAHTLGCGPTQTEFQIWDTYLTVEIEFRFMH